MSSELMPIVRRAAALVLLAALAGCTLFAPRYDPTLDQKITGAYQLVAGFAASGELGSYADKASYDATAPQYAEAQAQLAVARLRAENAPVQGKAAVRARALLGGLIQGCSDRIGSFAAQHRKFGIQPGTGATQAMMTSCDQAARAAQALKPGG